MTVKPPCPLCASLERTEVSSLTGGELRQLWLELLNKEFSVEAWGLITSDLSVNLERCEGCGFEFFDPRLTGTASFYAELEHTNYYTPQRPEFERTRSFAKKRKLRRVLDVGCGTGAFLDLMRLDHCDTHGLELNQSAASAASARGHRVHQTLLEGLCQDNIGPFDLITLFQVLEHVANPVLLLHQARTLLRPGGYIAVAVPSSEGILSICPWDPHQWPPHHVSRWRFADFDQLSKSCELSVVDRGGDILLGREIEHYWVLNNRLAPLVGRELSFRVKALPKLVSLAYRAMRLKYVIPAKGPSIYAHFQLAQGDLC